MDNALSGLIQVAFHGKRHSRHPPAAHGAHGDVVGIHHAGIHLMLGIRYGPLDPIEAKEKIPSAQ